METATFTVRHAETASLPSLMRKASKPKAEAKQAGRDSVDKNSPAYLEATELLKNILKERDFPSTLTSLDEMLVGKMAEVLDIYSETAGVKAAIKNTFTQKIEELKGSGDSSEMATYKVCQVYLREDVRRLIEGYSPETRVRIAQEVGISAFSDAKGSDSSYIDNTLKCFSDTGIKRAVEHYGKKYSALGNMTTLEDITTNIDHVGHERGIGGAQFLAECLLDKRFEEVMDRYKDMPEFINAAILDKMQWMIGEDWQDPEEEGKARCKNQNTPKVKRMIVDAMQWFLDEDMQRALERHKNDKELLDNFSDAIGWLMSQTFDRGKSNLILLPAKYLLDENLIQTFSNFPTGKKIIAEIAVCSGYLQSKEATGIIIDTAKSCPELAGKYVYAMREIFFTPANRDFMCTKGLMEDYREMTAQIAGCVKEYAHSPELMKKILETFVNIAENSDLHAAVKHFKDKEITKRVIDKYGEGEMASEVLARILDYASDFRCHGRKSALTCTKLLLSDGVKYSDVAIIGRRGPEIERMDAVIKDLDIIVDEEGTFSQKFERAKIYREMKRFGVKVSKPSMSEGWIEECRIKAAEKLMKIYNANAIEATIGFGKLGLGEIQLLLQINEDCKKDNTELSADDKKWIMYTASKIGQITKIFPKGKEYAEIKISNTMAVGGDKETEKEVDAAELTRLLAAGILSNSRRQGHFGNLRNALRYYPIEKLRAARSFIERSNPGKVFNGMKNEFLALKDEKSDPNVREESAQKLKAYLKDLSEKGKTQDKCPEDAEALSDLVDMVEGIERKTKFDSITIRMQHVNMTDIADNRDLLCCAFYPTGAYRRASLQYLLDPAIGLMWLKAANPEGKEIQSLGVAVLVGCVDKTGKKVLLVDSVEGGEGLQSIKENWMEETYNSILSAARDIGAVEVVFNTKVMNSTPRMFNEFLERKGLTQRRKYLKKIGYKEDNNRYLEAFPGPGSCPPTGNVSGYIAKIE